VGGNPVNWVDPYGLEAMPVPAGPIPLPIPNPTPYGSDANKTLAKGLDDLIGRLLGSLPSIRIECIGTHCIPVMHDEDGSDDSSEAQAPGCPTENDGFKPKKKWDGKKVKNPNGPGYGWPDKDGNVWVPTGPGSSAHGGPHWDVQSSGGRYINVYPGGRRRPGRK